MKGGLERNKIDICHEKMKSRQKVREETERQVNVNSGIV